MRGGSRPRLWSIRKCQSSKVKKNEFFFVILRADLVLLSSGQYDSTEGLHFRTLKELFEALRFNLTFQEFPRIPALYTKGDTVAIARGGGCE